MNPERLRELLEQLRQGQLGIDDALLELRRLPFRDLELATVDHHRALRQGCPEVILGQDKTVSQIASIAGALVEAGQNVLITRLAPDKADRLAESLPELTYLKTARIARIERQPVRPRPCPPVAVVTAGTSDLAVAEEAAVTLQAVGIEPLRIFDVGVAGIHRLLHRLDDFERASAVIAIAGMEGALPSVLGGIVSCPVVAVPTSTGYGTALGGLTALLGMLTSCAAGVTVVNIDNGFGAAMAVHRMLPQAG